MKTLKKTLCLVLALVMAFSLMSVASASNFDGYTDADEVGAAYVEAVDVLMGLGIVNGVTATELAPEGYYTRAQAAKIATYLAIGPTAAEMLPTGESFTDVPATHWASKYITYCASKNILNGVTATEYQPEAYVTGYQFAKMILAAAGYGAADEFVGSEWAVNTATLALDKTINLFKGDATAATNDPITRQQAMLIAFNAIRNEVKFQTYSEFWNSYSPVNPEKDFSDIYGVSDTTPAVADDGLSYYTWQVDSKDVSDAYCVDTLVASFPAGTTYKAIASAAGIGNNNTKTAAWYANGVQKETFSTAQVSEFRDAPATSKIEAPMDLYKDPNGNFKMMATYEYLALAELGSAITTVDNAGKYNWNFTVYMNDGDVTIATVAAKDAYVDEGYYVAVPKGDNLSASKLLSVVAADTVAGKVTGKGDGYIRIAGEKYLEGQYVKQIDDAYDFESTTFTFYLDTAGNVIGYATKSAAAATYEGMVYLTASLAKVTGSSLYGEFSASAKASVYFAGENALKTIDLAVVTNTAGTAATLGTTYTAGSDLVNDAAPLNAGWYRYNSSENGYVLTAIENPANTAVSLKAGEAAIITGKYADTKTVVTVYNYDATGKNVTVTTYTGIADYPAAAKLYNGENGTAAGVLATTSTTNESLLTNVEIFTTVNSATTLNYAWYVGAGEAYADGQYYQGFYVGGEYVEYKLAGESNVLIEENEGKLVALTLDTTGKIEAAVLVTVTSGEISYVGSTYITIGESATPVYLADGAAVYNVSTGYTGAADEIAVEDYITYAVNASGKIAIIYIVDAPEA